ncbi:MAG: hypothetical protein PWP51_283 [Clostridiales bacterium]|jgi:transcription-repair coupling factor (superfamily II helicase)|nr:hypothetical protein [Clostridiales bacterium]MDN5297730.1 hypothetical protein [Clostridiales bacterium]
MQQLINLFEHSKEYIEIEKSIDEGINPILVHGTDIFVMQWIAQRLSQKLERDVLLLFEDEQKARAAQEHIADSRLLTTREMVWFDTLAHSHDIAHERIETLLGMIDEQPKIVCASVNNLAYKYPPKEVLKRQHIDLDLDSPLSLEILRSKLFAYGYERVEIVESRGQYSIRGGIVDIFSTLAELPYRIELFGDEVDSIRTFDIETQTSVEKFNAIRIYPCTELILDDARIERAIHTLSALMKNQKRNRREKLEAMLEQIQERTYVEGIDRYYSLFYEKSDSLLDYLNSPIVVLVGNNQNLLRLKQYIDAYSRQFSDYLERGEVVAEQYGRVFEYAETMVRLKREQLLISEHLIKKLEYFEPEQIIKLSSRELTKYFGKFDQLAMDLRNWKLKGYHIGIVFNDDERMRRFIDQMRDFDVIVDTGTSQTNIMSSQAIALVGTAGQGFMIDTFKAILMTEHEIFGEGKRIKRKKLSNAKVIKAFSELSVGDYIVHESHGIGQYLGVEQLKIDQSKKDFLKIKYAGDDFLYIPVESAGVVQKYMGTDREKLKLNRLGGNEWKKTKSRAKKAIEDMTDELIELYAARKSRKGYAFDPDNEWQQEFESMFPYQETRDQLKCIEEIKSDMEKGNPMERLLCGDVGYGKTEVALRAAFKAVLNSKQVAILVPTTILAQQHYNNTVERFSKYPAKIEMLSRFRSKKEQDKIIENIRNGVVDVIIGTHRLLSNDVIFKDLGLLIIDEEQRFGVKHKEKIKMLKEQIDVLSLSATPIPRTLHMSMIGIRDMSVIEDPPEDRYPIQTYVVEYDAYLMREAIIRELERGGQVYFVHNRIADIDQVAAQISELVPDAKVQFAHGQMNEHRLERIMLDFMNNEFNVLVSTTIIETGLDIANVNTIIINDGDKYGLSQLYQLRGRVGRSNRLAYCYIFYQENKVLSEIAEKRLRAIKEFTELGAGFKIAMRDLEIRGSGNVLGTQQHGHMEAIGYDLYVKLLEESMLRKKGEIVLERREAKVDIAANAYIPEAYISNHQVKIEIYKKIAALDSRQACDGLYEEIEDRFGTVPTSIVNLMRIAFIKYLCEEMQIDEVSEADRHFVLKYHKDAVVSPLFLAKVMAEKGDVASVFAGVPLSIKIKITNRLRNKEEQLTMLEKFIESIYSFYSDYLS